MKKLTGLLLLFYLQIGFVDGQHIDRSQFVNFLDVHTSITDTANVEHSFFPTWEHGTPMHNRLQKIAMEVLPVHY